MIGKPPLVSFFILFDTKIKIAFLLKSATRVTKHNTVHVLSAINGVSTEKRKEALQTWVKAPQAFFVLFMISVESACKQD